MNESSVIRTAAALLSDDGENAEYDRAIVELTGELLGFTGDERDLVLAMLRGVQRDVRF